MSIYSTLTPTSLKQFYSENDIVDFIVKMKPNRSLVSGSVRLSGNLGIQVQRKDGNWSKLTAQDNLHLDPFVGVHSFIRSVNTQINNASVENVQMYNRVVGMMRQANNTLETLNTNSLGLTEMCGTVSNFQMLGTVSQNVAGSEYNLQSFSLIPQCAINMANGNLGASKASNIQLSFTLANAIEALYTDMTADDVYMKGDNGYTDVRYVITDLQLNFVELMMDAGSAPVIMPVKHLYLQTVNNETSYLNVATPQLYNSISCSFIKQDHRNTLFHNNLLCEKIYGLDDNGGRLEILINSSDTPIPYPIETYQETALNYLRSLNGNVNNNCITNTLLTETCSFGIGFSLLTSSNDRLAISLRINAEAYEFVIPPYDAFLFINSFVSV
jgi:hypothetical protein